MQGRATRWVLIIVLGLVTLTALALGTGWFLLQGSVPVLDGTRAVAGLQQTVRITRDADGVATLDAGNREDMAYALGFVHAQERFFQMDLLRRVAAGELSALVGKAALKVDLDHRRHRFRARERADLAQLPDDQRHLLEDYARGVNAGLASLRVRPWEYLLLGVKPRPWRPEDSLLVIDAMFLDLNQDGRDRRELDLSRLHATLPQPLVDFLAARDGHWEAPLQGPVTPPAKVPPASVFDLRHGKPASVADVTLPLSALPGSNNFAVSGALTGGPALVANDMHLTLRVPDIWYRARLRYADASGHPVDLNGVTLPGTPLLIAGSNGHIAWGFTNSYGDWMDWVRVTVKPGDPTRYRVPGGWARFVDHRETIRVKGGRDRHETVRDTRWGPVMAHDADGTPLALAWIAQLPRTHNLNLMQLEQIDTVHAALMAAPTFGMPPQNIVVGDSAGRIGWTVTGNALPLRAGFDPSLPADWSQQGTGWIGFASPLQYPRIENPPGNRLWTANNRTTGGDWLHLLGDGGYDIGARAQQIRDDLRARDRFDPRDLLHIQLDDRAVFLRRWKYLLQATLAQAPGHALDPVRRVLAHWSGRAGIDSVAYRLVRDFRERVTREVLAPFAGRAKQRYPAFRWPLRSEAAVWALVQQKPAWLLNPAYPSWDTLLRMAARHVQDHLSRLPGGLQRQTWGRHNTAAIDHPLASALPGFIARRLDMPAQPLPGDHDMPRVQAPDFGASERFAIAPGQEARSYLEMPAGQADNPLTPYYGAGHEAWVHGRPTPLLPGPAKWTLVLRPKGAEKSP